MMFHLSGGVPEETMQTLKNPTVTTLLLLTALVAVSCSSSRVRYGAEGERMTSPSDTMQFGAEGYYVEDAANDSIPYDYYIDDEMKYQLDLAEENYKMGFDATLDSNWLEAQFYYESALEILAGLDIDPEDSTPASLIYDRIMNEVITDYKTTLLYIASLPGESSPSAVVARYDELEKLSQGEEFDTASVASLPDTVIFDMPITWNDKVEKCITYFQTVGRKPFEASLARMGRYLPLMEKIIEEEGVPHDLVYLPLIESGFNPRAYSWAHAVGPWQFIAGTGKMYGLRRTKHYDERRDFVKSTRAAAKHLRDLYAQTQDWYLALLGYNAGLGNVNKLVKRNNTRDYFEMKIRNSQMRDYVPLYLAAVLIAKEQEKYGFDVEPLDPIEFDTVTIDRSIALSDVAKSVGCTVDELRDLNPELLRKTTPPDIKQYVLRVPPGQRDEFCSSYPNLKTTKEPTFAEHKVRKGETVSLIARKFGVSQFAIVEANNLRRPYLLSIGQRLVIPGASGEQESYADASGKSKPKTSGGQYTVRSGDTLWDLARAFGTTSSELRRMNGLSRNASLHVGQKLKVPSGSIEVASSDRTSKSSSQHPKKSSTAASTVEYRVRSGDNLWAIAKKFGTTVRELLRLNSLSTAAKLSIGQILKVPDLGRSQTGTKGKSHYVVKRGDTLASISESLGVSVENLRAWNEPVNPRRLQVGAKLKVHGN
jgi:membrane-bound lytic murein transglycosylase D